MKNKNYEVANNGRDIKLNQVVSCKWLNTKYTCVGRDRHMVTLQGGQKDDIIVLNINEAIRKYK